ncbi:hypothetical protein GCM10022225_37090 [Plantactinospora mayteni]|uniref:Uncharacterized protein n=1 Tax=Plantactinospora mayteni TaxID=566021 RepID=A0ABQ4EKK3_9ACTN|nr:hypothetical protein Pma05_18620 [Plantactinospora mayteni]
MINGDRPKPDGNPVTGTVANADTTRERETARQRRAAPKGQILPGTSQAKGARGQATVERPRRCGA